MPPLGGANAADPRPQASIEAWAGAQAFQRVWSLYTGATFAPFGDLGSDGFRVRSVAGYGDYLSGTVSFADLLIGYHWQVGTLTIKFLGGLTGANHDAEDASSPQHGLGIGGKAVLETWWNVTDRTWLSTDLAYGSLHDSYQARVRLGWRFNPALSFGMEGGAAGSLQTDVARVGPFVRYEWATGEFSVSGGLAREGFGGPWDDGGGAFVTINALTRF